jgi:hypothetical protein
MAADDLNKPIEYGPALSGSSCGEILGNGVAVGRVAARETNLKLPDCLGVPKAFLRERMV